MSEQTETPTEPMVSPDPASQLEEIQVYCQNLESQVAELTERLRMPELGGIAYTTLYGHKTVNGHEVEFQINLTQRGWTAQEAFDGLWSALTTIAADHKLVPYRMPAPPAPVAPQPQPAQAPAMAGQPPAPAAGPAQPPAPVQPVQQVQAPAPAGPPQPQYVPVGGGANTEKIQVKSVAHGVTDKGKHKMVIRGGKYSKFGVTAWPEILPAVVAQQLEQWPIGTEYQPPSGMEWAFFDPEAKKVTGFSPS